MAHRQRRAVAVLVRDLKDAQGSFSPETTIGIPGVGGITLRRASARSIAEDYIKRVESGDSVQKTDAGRKAQNETITLLKDWLARNPKKE